MIITDLEIKNIKGIEHKQLMLQLMPNKPNLLVAPNGFGKSSIATAFSCMNSQRMNLAEKDYFKEDTSHLPELSITVNGQKLRADSKINEIRQKYDIIVIQDRLISKATKHKMGGFTQAIATMEIESILIRSIPKKAEFDYQPSRIKSDFGRNGKILPNIKPLLQNPLLFEVVNVNDLKQINDSRIQKSIKNIVERINQKICTADKIKQWISCNVLDECRSVAVINNLLNSLINRNLVTSVTEAFLTVYQIVEIYKNNTKLFCTALNWLQYTAEKKNYEDLLNSFCSSSWRWAEINEDKRNKKLSVIFPLAHQLSNGQRDVVTLVVQMYKALYDGSKKPMILVIDDVFDYLDDANLVVFQYYVISLIETYKQRNQFIYPIILTHLDPGIFFDFCFNRHKIHVHYLGAQQTHKYLKTMELIKARENENSIKDRLEKYWFHYNPNTDEIDENDWPSGVQIDWRKSDVFQKYTESELLGYLADDNYDPLAVCFALRVKIEQEVFQYLNRSDDQDEFLEQIRTTKKKIEFVADRGIDIRDIYFLLGLIYNTNLHWKQGKDYVTPLVNKLNHPTIKKLISTITMNVTVVQ